MNSTQRSKDRAAGNRAEAADTDAEPLGGATTVAGSAANGHGRPTGRRRRFNRVFLDPRFDTAFTAFSGLFSYGLALLTGPLLARSLGAAGRGDYAAATVAPQILGYALLFGFPQAAIYFAHQRRQRELVLSAWVWAAAVGGSLAIAGHLTLDTALAVQLASYCIWYVTTFTFTRGWPGRGFSRDTFKTQLDYGYRVGFGSLAQVLNSRLDQFLLVPFVSSAELGRYAIAVTAAGVSGPVANAMALALFPKIRHSLDPTAGRRALNHSLRITFVLSLFVASLVGLTAPWVIPWLFGPSFRNAVVPLWLLLPGQVAADLGAVINQKLLADGRPAAVSRALGLALLVTVTGLVIVVSPWGINGAAIVTSVAGLVFLGYVWLESRTDARTDPFAGETGLPKHELVD